MGKNIISLAKRLNNSKRKHLFVNNYQGKHVPCGPKKSIEMFKELSSKIKLKDGNTIVIGFAETATAIGAYIAEFLNSEYYLHTTREYIDESLNIVKFEEEHSHAVEQKLYSYNKDIFLESSNIVFVEDELSTGKTILNFIESLRLANVINKNHNIYAVSIVNAMTSENLLKFKEENIEVYYNLRINFEYKNELENINFEDTKYSNTNKNLKHCELSINNIENFKDPRIVVKTKEYIESVNKIKEIIGENINSNDKVLVLGTEECMYPSIKIGDFIENKYACSVKVHSTTRSPIEVSNSINYPLNSRYKLNSFYEDGRETYLYNLEMYDKVIVITDTNLKGKAFLELESILKNLGNENIKYYVLNRKGEKE